MPAPPRSRKTVGQLVADSARLYRDRFWRTIALGLPIAGLDVVDTGHSIVFQTIAIWVASPLLTAAYMGGCTVAGAPIERRRAGTAFAVGLLVFLPVPVLLRLYVLPAVAWLALLGLAVPAVMFEGRSFRSALDRGRRLAQADYVHSLGTMATLTVTYVLTRLVLVVLLRSAGEAADRSAAFLADLVVSPLLYVGSALLYLDLAARTVGSGPQTRRRRDADVHPAVEPHRPGRSDPEVEPRSAAGGQP
jgi:hypothetical protein